MAGMKMMGCRLTCSLGLWAVVGLAASSDCVAANYVEQYGEALAASRTGQAEDMEKPFKKELKNERKGTALTVRFELAALYRLMGNAAKSRELLDESRRLAEEYEMRAKISGSDVMRNLGSIFTNEGARIYKGPGYEKVMSHTINALNHVFLDDAEGARVEVRVAREYQQFEREQHEKDIAKAEKEAEEDHKKASDTMSRNTDKFDSVMAEMNKAAATVRSEFENPFTYFLASVIFRAAGPEYDNDAWVAIKNAHDIVGDVGPVRDTYWLMARRQFQNDPEGLKQAIGEAAVAEVPPPTDLGEVVVVFEDGEVARKEESSVPIVVPTAQTIVTQNLALPVYTRGGRALGPLRVEAEGRAIQTEPIVNVSSLAMKYHKERMRGIITRGIVRVGSKGVVQDQMKRKFGIFGDIAGKIGTNVTERADLRAWYTLPDQIHAARVLLAPGSHDVKITVPGEIAQRTVRAEVRSGKISLIDVQAYEGIVNVWSKDL